MYVKDGDGEEYFVKIVPTELVEEHNVTLSNVLMKKRTEMGMKVNCIQYVIRKIRGMGITLVFIPKWQAEQIISIGLDINYLYTNEFLDR